MFCTLVSILLMLDIALEGSYKPIERNQLIVSILLMLDIALEVK